MKDKLGKAYGVRDQTDEARGEKQSRPISPRSRGIPVPVKARAPAETPRKESLPQGDFVKTGRPGIEKAAKFLLLIGQNEAAQVLKHLKPAEIEKISAEITRINKIDTVEANEILTEFGWLAKTQGGHLEGGPEIAEGMLTTAFGSDRAKEVLRKATQKTRKPFAFVSEFSADELTPVIKDESPQIIAMMLSHIAPELASGIISRLPETQRVEVVQRIARLERSSPEVIERVESALKDKLAATGRHDKTDSLDGAAILADILRHAGNGMEDSILSGIERSNPTLSHSIRERLFTADDILRVSNRDIQKALRPISERDIALMLKGKSQNFKDKLLANVSQSKRSIILDEYDIMGSVRREDAENATKPFVDALKQKWERGELILDGQDDLVD